MELLISFLVSILITAIAYLLIPVIFCVSKKKLTKKQIKIIVAINSICVWFIFMIVRISTGTEGTSAAVFLWSAIAYFLMKKYCLEVENNEEQSAEAEQNTYTPSLNAQTYTEVSLSVEDEQPTESNGFFGKDMLIEKHDINDKTTNNPNCNYSLADQNENTDYHKSLQSLKNKEDITHIEDTYFSRSELSYKEEKKAIQKAYREKKRKLKKERNHNSNKNGFKYATIIISTLLIVSITINTNQFIEKEDLNYQNKTLSTRLELLTERLDEAEENESKYFELYLQYSKKASFLTKRIALIDGDNPYYYHTYDCEDFKNADTFLAFNIEAAKNRGYVPHSCWD